MASRTRTLALVCPPSGAAAAARARYKRMFKAAALGSSFLEGELMMRVTKRPRPVVKKKKKTTRKRATSRKRR